MFFFFFSSRRRHTRCGRDWSSDVCSSDLGPLTDANLRLLAEEITQLDALIGKCETELASLTADEQRQVQQWLAARDRYATLIPVEALTARQQGLEQPTFDPVVLDATAEGA